MTDSTPVEQQFVSVVPYDRDTDKFFVLKRCAKHSIGMWEFPSGKVEPGESMFRAAMREFREEAGVGMFIIEPFHQVTTPDINDPTKLWRTAYFLTHACIFDNPATNNEPHIHSECGWFTLAELSTMNLVFPTEWMVKALSSKTLKL